MSLNSYRPGVSSLLASLGHSGRRVVLGHKLNTEILTKSVEQNKGPCIIFMIPATIDKQKKSSHNPHMQQPF